MTLFGKTLPQVGKIVALHRLGHSGFEAALADFMAADSTTSPFYNHPYAAAMLMAALGDNDQAFSWLERSRDIPIWGFELSYGDIFFNSLHDDPRWEEHMEKVGLSEHQRSVIAFAPTLPPPVTAQD